jgi:hypothetical protein
MKGNNGTEPQVAFYIPVMHRSMVNAALPEWVRFIEPGLHQSVPEGSVRPEGLPLAPAQSRRFIEDCLRFGAQFKEPEEMRYFGVAPMEDFYSQTSMAIRSSLTQAEDQGNRDEMMLQAQKTLLLRWFYEERRLEVESLETDIERSMDSLGEIMGVDEDEDDEQGFERAGIEELGRDREPFDEPFLHAVLTILPEESVLFTVDEDLLGRLRERGVSFSRDGGLLKARIQGQELSGVRQKDRHPWQEKRFFLITVDN